MEDNDYDYLKFSCHNCSKWFENFFDYKEHKCDVYLICNNCGRLGHERKKCENGRQRDLSYIDFYDVKDISKYPKNIFSTKEYFININKDNLNDEKIFNIELGKNNISNIINILNDYKHKDKEIIKQDNINVDNNINTEDIKENKHENKINSDNKLNTEELIENEVMLINYMDNKKINKNEINTVYCPQCNQNKKGHNYLPDHLNPKMFTISIFNPEYKHLFKFKPRIQKTDTINLQNNISNNNNNNNIDNSKDDTLKLDLQKHNLINNNEFINNDNIYINNNNNKYNNNNKNYENNIYKEKNYINKKGTSIYDKDLKNNSYFKHLKFNNKANNDINQQYIRNNILDSNINEEMNIESNNEYIPQIECNNQNHFLSNKILIENNNVEHKLELKEKDINSNTNNELRNNDINMYDNNKTNILKENIIKKKQDDNMKIDLNKSNTKKYYLPENKEKYNIPKTEIKSIKYINNINNTNDKKGKKIIINQFNVIDQNNNRKTFSHNKKIDLKSKLLNNNNKINTFHKNNKNEYENKLIKPKFHNFYEPISKKSIYSEPFFERITEDELRVMNSTYNLNNLGQNYDNINYINDYNNTNNYNANNVYDNTEIIQLSSNENVNDYNANIINDNTEYIDLTSNENNNDYNANIINDNTEYIDLTSNENNNEYNDNTEIMQISSNENNNVYNNDNTEIMQLSSNENNNDYNINNINDNTEIIDLNSNENNNEYNPKNIYENQEKIKLNSNKKNKLLSNDIKITSNIFKNKIHKNNNLNCKLSGKEVSTTGKINELKYPTKIKIKNRINHVNKKLKNKEKNKIICIKHQDNDNIVTPYNIDIDELREANAALEAYSRKHRIETYKKLLAEHNKQINNNNINTNTELNKFKQVSNYNDKNNELYGNYDNIYNSNLNNYMNYSNQILDNNENSNVFFNNTISNNTNSNNIYNNINDNNIHYYNFIDPNLIKDDDIIIYDHDMDLDYDYFDKNH